MNDKRCTDKFKIEAEKQITEHGYLVQDVTQRVEVSSHSLYLWQKKYRDGVVSAGHIDDRR
ncbi:transposase [Halodesulfovibrio marinisediminis]|uniref:Transposase n=1 Tax=Halodesulfovibrio marinisediminis DSM 17456 TaxID=1121457 RepID=A0A1N6DX01_9BACT|nr:transposase [Halodesulfovibrio marinisediminis]SIN75281.1 Transposase [Halodesulfovibrio marinisediminis DSM 17456]